MDSLQAELNLAEDVEELRRFASEYGWAVEGPAGLDVYVTVSSIVDHESYMLWFHCAGYPDAPFALKPVDPETRSPAVPTAWPACEGFRPTTDLCMPVCAEGYAVHPEWRSDPRWRWEARGNPLLRVTEEIQLRINDPTKYRGRNR